MNGCKLKTSCSLNWFVDYVLKQLEQMEIELSFEAPVLPEVNIEIESTTL